MVQMIKVDESNIEELVRNSYHLNYFAYKKGLYPKNWDKTFLSYKENKKFIQYHSACLFKLLEAKFVLEEQIKSYFNDNPSFMAKQNSEEEIFSYSHIIIQRAYLLGSFLWALSGSLDIFSRQCCLLLNINNPKDYYSFKQFVNDLKNKKNKLKNDFEEELKHTFDKFKMFTEKDQKEALINQFYYHRNLLTHNPHYLQIVGKGKYSKDTYLLLLDKQTLSNIKEKYDLIINIKIDEEFEALFNKEIIKEPVPEFCNVLYQHFTEFISETYGIFCRIKQPNNFNERRSEVMTSTI